MESSSLIISETVLILISPLFLIVREGVTAVSNAVAIIVCTTSVRTYLDTSGIVRALVTIIANTITIEVLPFPTIGVVEITE
jgi:hypothetical protein